MRKGTYIVMIDDNFHYMDESHRYRYGEYSTYKEAVKICEQILDEDLDDMRRQGVEEKDLSATWAMFGSDPFIFEDVEGNRFSARNYVSQITE